MVLPEGLHGRQRGEAGRQPVVHQHHVAPLDVGQRPALAVAADAALQLDALGGLDLAQHLRGHLQGRAQVLVDQAGPVLGDGADGQLGSARGAELAGDHHVEGCSEGLGDGVGHADPAAGQGEHDGVDQLPLGEMAGQDPPGVEAISEGS